ncbi:MAG: hypothetical protein AAFP03_11410 [Cyanobacteria bacterium J06598_3]
MASPFSTVEAFQQASDGPTQGAIYTFAHAPVINNIALLLAVLLFLWFLTRLIKKNRNPTRFDKSLGHLSLVIVAGLLSLAGANRDLSTASKAALNSERATDEP